MRSWLLYLLTALAAAPSASAQTRTSSADALARLPDGEEKRRFILDCTGCHQFDSVTVGSRSRDDWAAAVQRMLGFAGAGTGFPIISADRDAGRTADWLARALAEPAAPRPAPRAPEGAAEITEFPMSAPQDLLHDVAVDSAGRIVVTGMFTSRMLVLDPATGGIEEVATPAPQPRAVTIDAAGRWWVLLGGPRTIARYDPRERRWTSWPVGMYPHSIGLEGGRAWFNGHFTHDPELIGSVDSTGMVRTDTVPAHPALAPIPYELRAGPDGRIWMSELLGNRIIGYTPATRRFAVFTLPTAFSGPRRFDVDAAGVLWIPAYASGALVRLDPASGRFEEFPLPERDALPYVARVDGGTGMVWIGTGAADAVYRFDPRWRRFTRFGLPSRGAMVRHIAIDTRTHDVWLAYGASPGRISARIARLRARD